MLYDAKDQHSSKEVLTFVRFIDPPVAKDLEIHVVLDNLSAHNAEPVVTWLAHPKGATWHVYFPPTSSSWLNLVESWSSQLTNRRLKKGTFTSVDQLEETVGSWTDGWNDDPQPFIWKKSADEIVA